MDQLEKNTSGLQRPETIKSLTNLKSIKELGLNDRCSGYWVHVLYVPLQ